MNIFVNKDGQQHGPFTAEQVRHELKIGAFSATDYAWHEGLTDWIPLDSLFTPPASAPPVSAPPVSADRTTKSTLTPLIVTLLILASGGYYFWTSSQPKLSDACKRYLDSYLIEAGKLASLSEQGASILAFRDQLATVTSSFQMVEESWAEDYHTDILEFFAHSIEGYNLALRLWSAKLNDYSEPTEPDVNGWATYIEYGEQYDHGNKTTLKIKAHPA